MEQGLFNTRYGFVSRIGRVTGADRFILLVESVSIIPERKITGPFIYG